MACFDKWAIRLAGAKKKSFSSKDSSWRFCSLQSFGNRFNFISQMKTVLSFLEDSAVGTVLYIAWVWQLTYKAGGTGHASCLIVEPILPSMGAIMLLHWCSQFITMPSLHFTWDSIYITVIPGSDGSPDMWKNVMPHISESIF